MDSKIVLLLVCVSLIHVVHVESMAWCSATEEYTDNYMPLCEPSCDIPDHDLCFYISHKAGCTCKQGFFRNDDGFCVTSDQCFVTKKSYPAPGDLSPYQYKRPFNPYNQYPDNCNPYNIYDPYRKPYNPYQSYENTFPPIIYPGNSPRPTIPQPIPQSRPAPRPFPMLLGSGPNQRLPQPLRKSVYW